MVVQIFLFGLSATMMRIEGRIYMAAFVINAEGCPQRNF
jgi:hypothetical protein